MVDENQSASEEKPVKKEETAADLLGANIEQVKVRKAKGKEYYFWNLFHRCYF